MPKFATIYTTAMRKYAERIWTGRSAQVRQGNQSYRYDPNVNIHSNNALGQAATTRPTEQTLRANAAAAVQAQTQARRQQRKKEKIDRSLNSFFGGLDRQQAALNTATAGTVPGTPSVIAK